MAPTKSQVKKELVKALKPKPVRGYKKTVEISAIDLYSKRNNVSVLGYIDYGIYTRKAESKKKGSGEIFYGWEFLCKLDKNNNPRGCKLTGATLGEPVGQTLLGPAVEE